MEVINPQVKGVIGTSAFKDEIILGDLMGKYGGNLRVLIIDDAVYSSIKIEVNYQIEFREMIEEITNHSTKVKEFKKTIDYSEFQSNAEFNEAFLKDICSSIKFGHHYEIDKAMMRYYSKFQYIYRLLFSIFIDNPNKPKIEFLGFDIDDINLLYVLGLLCEHFKKFDYCKDLYPELPYVLYHRDRDCSMGNGTFFMLKNIARKEIIQGHPITEEKEEYLDLVLSIFDNDGEIRYPFFTQNEVSALTSIYNKVLEVRKNKKESTKIIDFPLCKSKQQDCEPQQESKEVKEGKLIQFIDNNNINNIVSNFVQTQKKHGIDVSSEEIMNAKSIIKEFLEKNTTRKPIAIDLPMGAGKSVLLLEFIKYMCEIDKEFSAIIVTKTIKEATNFVVKLGLEDKEREEALCNSEDRLQKLSEAYQEDEGIFIGRVIRGFNPSDCLKYDSFEQIYGNAEACEHLYTLCSSCREYTCKVKKCKQEQNHHRVIVISHARLFLSSENEDIISELNTWGKGQNKKPRKFFAIDEKPSMFNPKSITLDKWKSLLSQMLSENIGEDLKNELREVDHYLCNLSFPDNKDRVVPIKPYKSNFCFNEKIKEILISIDGSVKDIDELETIEKFLIYGGTVSRFWKDNKEILFYNRFVDIAKYFSTGYDNFIILDATSRLDLDYSKADVKFLDDLEKTKQYDVEIFKNTSVNVSKSKLVNNPSYSGASDYKSHYNCNVEFISLDIKDVIEQSNGKTLIVVYKDIKDFCENIYEFRKDIEDKLKQMSIEQEYKVIHFGQYTTGVNDFRDYGTIVIINQQNKGSSYYKNKAFFLSHSQEQLQLNEYLIDTLQQIGRTAIRQNKKVNVYIMGELEDLVYKVKDYFNARVFQWETQYYNVLNTASDAQQNMTWYKIARYVLDRISSVGDILRKSDIREFIVDEQGINLQTYRKSLTSDTLINCLKGYGIITNPTNNRELIKIK